MADTEPNSPIADDADSSTQGGPPSSGFLVPPSRQGFRGAMGAGSGGGGRSFDSGPASHVPASLRHIDWGEAFAFVHLFKAFRVAIHPAKLMLALAAVLLIYGGGRLLDGIWNFMPDRWQAFPGEVSTYDRYYGGLLGDQAGPGDFHELRDAQFAGMDRYQSELKRELGRVREVDPDRVEHDDLINDIKRSRDASIIAAGTTLTEAGKRLEGESTEDWVARAAQARRTHEAAVRQAYADARERSDRLEESSGQGLFVEFYEYEVAQLDNATSALLGFNFLGSDGMFTSLYRAVWTGPAWGFTQHPLYFSLLSLWSLIVLSIFGGAIARIAAVQVARDEKIGLRSALRFSSGKFVSFLSAPLIPVLVIALIVAAIAIVVLLLSWISMIPYMGWTAELGVAILFFLALLGGFLMALTFVGLIGGISLMYPTIAAEGTDSFDAISRSFSYLFARPWRLAFYAIVSLAYGAVTFLFVRLFVWLVLVCTHGAVSLALLREAAGTNLLDALWPTPTPQQLSYDIDFINLTGIQSVAAVIIAIWVYLVLSLLTAYALSLYLSSGTIIYFLMRREVDATELDDVYIDPGDEEYGAYADLPEDPLATPGSSPATPSATPSA